VATLTPGQSLTTPGRTIGAGDINLFAGLVGDFTPIHVDEVFAKSSPFGTRIAHGPLAMATAINQTNAIRQSYQLVTVSSCSQSYRWLAISLRRKGPPPKPAKLQKVVQF